MSEADEAVFAAMMVSGLACQSSDGCTNHPNVCIDCDAGGEPDGTSCINDEDDCDCPPPNGCTGSSIGVSDETACSEQRMFYVSRGKN